MAVKHAHLWIALLVASLALGGWQLAATYACPFCSSVSLTLSEEIKQADAALILKLTKVPKRPADDKQAIASEPVKATFSVVQALKGENMLGGKKEIEILYFGAHPLGTTFFVTGVDPKDLAWTTPNALSPRAQQYIAKIVALPESGAERLAFFQQYFEDEDPLLAGDAYDEFAKAPYADVKGLQAKMDRSKLLTWVNDAKITPSHRRLYLTMLGVCGQPEDLGELEKMLRTEDRQLRNSLDALVACYLSLKGPAGLPLVEDMFLKNSKAEYVDTYATIMALRFHGQEASVIPRERLLEALRHMLNRPQLADLVIPDLARWEDWTAMEQLVELFKNAKEDSIWVRVPVINYLRACPKPEAKAAIDELAKIDPDTVKRANQFFPFASSAKPPASAVRPEDKKKPKEAEKAVGEGAGGSASDGAGKSGAANKQSANNPTLNDNSLNVSTQAIALEALAAATGQPPTAVITAPVVPVAKKDETKTVAAVSRPETLAKAAAPAHEQTTHIHPGMLLVYAGCSALGLTVFMYSLLATTAKPPRM